MSDRASAANATASDKGIVISFLLGRGVAPGARSRTRTCYS